MKTLVQYKEYLGDSVYASHDGHHIVLTTENGYRATNVIYLEPDVWKALVRYVAQIYGASGT